MNMSFGVAAAPVPPPAGEGAGGDLPPSSSAPSTAVPLVPPSFSLSSASFTFQGSSANPMPPPRPSFAPSSGFSFPGAQANPPPSSGPPSLTPPPLFPLSGAAPRFSYPGPPTNTSSIAPPSTPAVPPFSMPSGFSYQGPSGNPPPLSVVASGSPSFAISNSLMGFSGHSPGIHVRPPPAQMAIIGMPSTATSQAPQGQISGVQAATQPTQAQSMHGAGPSPPLQVLGTPPGQSSTSSSPQPLSLQGSAPATASHPGLQGSTTAAAPSATTPGTASISVSSGIGTSVETEETHAPMSHQSTPGGFPPHPVPIPPATQMRPSMPGTLPPPGMAVSPQVVSGATQPLQGQGTAGAVLPASVPPTTVVPPPAMPPVQVFPGQMPVTTLSSPVGAVPARPGPMPPTSTTLPFVPPRPVYSTNPVAAPPLVPPGVLGSAPAGMAPRFPAPPFAPMVRTPNFPLRTASPLVRPPPGTMLRPGTLVPKFQMGPAGADLSKAVGPHLLLEKPQTLVYVGKIASTVDDDFLRSILELCGPIKSWKRAQEPTVGTPKGFGFCEFESAEGVLRALRLLNGFSLEGQELKITVNPTTREYLERFVQKKKEREQQLKLEASQAIETEVETAPGVEAPEPVKKPVVEAQNNDPSIENQGSDVKRFGLVNDEDKGADDEAQKKLTSLLEERARLMPLPPPPPLPSASDAPCKSNSMSDTPAKSRDGDSVADGGKTVGQEGTNEEETSENKASSELDRPETSSSDRGRRLDHHRDRERDRERERDRDKGRDRESRDRDRDRDRDREREREREFKREKEWELEQMERDRERSRARRERERELRMRDAERVYEDREKVWEEREKEKERIRNVDREKEKEREKLRWRLIKDQEEESDDEGWKKWRRRGDPYGERKRIQRERDDDEKDRLKEEEEVVEAKRRKLKEDYEEQVKKRLAEMAQMEAAEAAAKALDGAEGGTLEPEATKNAGAIVSESKERNLVQLANGGDDEVSTKSACDMVIDEEVENSLVSMEIDEKRNSSPAPKKLGFGLVGSGRRTAVPSVFHQEDEQEAPKDRGLRQLVPIDYTVEEMQAVSSLKANVTLGSAALNLAAAAEFAKSLSNLGNSSSKEELESERDRARRHSEKSKDKNQWVEDRGKDRERGSRDEMDRFRERDKDKHRYSDGNREKDHTSAKLDTKQLIDSIPKTKEELFGYIIDWKIYDQHELHERMRPWIQKKITEFLGEEEDTLVDFIVSNTRKHTGAANMLELLTTILDDEAEMFVMKMWRMLIFEIKKVETGLSTKPKA